MTDRWIAMQVRGHAQRLRGHLPYLRSFCVVCLVAAQMGTATAFADESDDRIATDRPDFVESADVVGAGVFQLETSIAFERNTQKNANVRTWTTPTLLRYGISKTLELRLETDGFTHQMASGVAGQSDAQSGMSDTSLGMKWHISDGDDKGSAATALLVHVDLDSGSSSFRRNGIAVSLRGVAEWELAGDSSLGLMGGVVFDRDESGERFQSGILAVTFSKPLADNVRGFVELAGRTLAEQRFGGNVMTFDTGVTYAVGKDMQWDVSAAFGLNRETPDYAVGIGFSVRFR